MDIAGRGHRGVFRLEHPPLAPDHADLRIIDRLAEHRAGEGDFASGKGARYVHYRRDLTLPRPSANPAPCRGRASTLGQGKSKRRNTSMSETADRVKKIVVEHLGVDADKVTEEASFIDDLGADSLDIVELVMAFEEEFGVEIPDDAAEKIATVKDAIDYID